MSEGFPKRSEFTIQEHSRQDLRANFRSDPTHAVVEKVRRI